MPLFDHVRRGYEYGMRTRCRTTIAALATTGALTVLAGACGGDDDVPASPTSPPATTEPVREATANLQIDYRHDGAGVSFGYGIECGPEADDVVGDAERAEVDAAAACAALDEPAVVQRLVEGPGDEICTEQYGGDDVADITGTVSGEHVDTTVDRADGCGISDWDDLLDALLPPPVGVVDPATSPTTSG